MRPVREYDIIVHGVQHVQYFQGCGVSGTKFLDCYTGVGLDAYEAYENALESAVMDWDTEGAENWLGAPKPGEHQVPEDAHEEINCYVSVRLR
jgi:hypothetical protein